MNANARMNRSADSSGTALDTERQTSAANGKPEVLDALKRLSKTAAASPVGEAGFDGSNMPRIMRPLRPAPLRSLITVVVILFFGTLLGIASAYFMVERDQPLVAVTIGPWSTYPKAGTAEADPYSVAIYTRSARVPLASGEGVALTARTDSDGNGLDASCVYRISGRTPQARLWTLTATDTHGHLKKTGAGRTFLTSQQLLWREDGNFVVMAAQTPRSGNWLPLAIGPSADRSLLFVLRLYDAPVTTESSLNGAEMPIIERLGCS